MPWNVTNSVEVVSTIETIVDDLYEEAKRFPLTKRELERLSGNDLLTLLQLCADYAGRLDVLRTLCKRIKCSPQLLLNITNLYSFFNIKRIDVCGEIMRRWFGIR
ncbi:hypothetical protein DRH14_03880 [Candidatus Shapirobacteria bacterium]|nr:MAG: hypothetical protein DRH14_03880 [Candidatus Shapirobacteria bacterium]